MKKLLKMLSLTLAMTTLLATGAMAAPKPAPANAPAVRVNGEIIDFPDAQPYVDANSRTLIPARIVAEKLGAKVEWNPTNQTATITKGTTEVMLQVGSPHLSVAVDGAISNIEMDTAAVVKENRVYVPVRYVAEALGAKVDYSGKYNTVGIYADVLTPEQIDRLQAYPYTQPDYVIGYQEAKACYDEAAMEYLYGDRSGMETFANAREHLYHTMARNQAYTFESSNKTLNPNDTDAFFKMVVDEAIAGISYESERLSIKFHADESCIYQADCMDRTTATVRGTAEVLLHVSPLELECMETARLCSLGFTQLYQDTILTSDVDVHMNTQSSYNVNIHTIVPLGNEN